VVSGGTTHALNQVSYDAAGRVQCSAQRMNPTYFSSLPSEACTLGITSATYGADRIVKKTYDAVGKTTPMQTAYGLPACRPTRSPPPTATTARSRR
jgi:hypothetical protein